MANNLTEMENVYPYIRLECSQVPVSGSLVCEQSGRYIIEFDNYYSWFSAKQLRYNIEIDELCNGSNNSTTSKNSITGGGGIPLNMQQQAKTTTNAAKEMSVKQQ